MNGDSTQLRQALASVGGGAHALATQILGDPDAAADAVQDAIVKVLRRPGAYDPSRGALRPWFLAVVRRRCLDLLRQRRPATGEVDTLPSELASPEDAAAASEEARTIHAALARLPAEQREILILRDFNELTYAEIAEVLAIQPGTVMSRLHRARLALRREVTDGTL